MNINILGEPAGDLKQFSFVLLIFFRKYLLLILLQNSLYKHKGTWWKNICCWKFVVKKKQSKNDFNKQMHKRF